MITGAGLFASASNLPIADSSGSPGIRMTSQSVRESSS
jgi:hypothetical protein